MLTTGLSPGLPGGRSPCPAAIQSVASRAMRYSSRFFLYAPLALLLLLTAAVVIHWWKVAGALDTRLKAMKGHEAVPGVTLDWANLTISGFPFRLDVMFDGLSVKGAGPHGPFAWKGDKFAVHALTYGA